MDMLNTNISWPQLQQIVNEQFENDFSLARASTTRKLLFYLRKPILILEM